jgi:hypothetical protein
MAEPPFDYPRWIAEALVEVARRALREVAESGLPGEHHFLLTFRTDAPGVLIPQNLRNHFPQEMTIVLQHQFWGLAVTDEAFSVSLRFSGTVQQVTVPFAALTAFVDPSVGLGLQFRAAAEPGDPGPPTAASEPEPETASTPASAGGGKNVIAFEAFRKK